MELEKIWKTYNISFILILPLFKNIIQHIKTKNNYNVSIHSLFCEYGLINCYLLNSKSEYDGHLKLVFSKNKILKVFVCRSYVLPIAKKVNITAERLTLADNPDKQVYIQIIINIKIVLISAALLCFFWKKENGLNNTSNMINNMPTCNPETAKICMVPVLA